MTAHADELVRAFDEYAVAARAWLNSHGVTAPPANPERRRALARRMAARIAELDRRLAPADASPGDGNDGAPAL